VLNVASPPLPCLNSLGTRSGGTTPSAEGEWLTASQVSHFADFQERHSVCASITLLLACADAASRYAGTLHEINSDESTVSLENVRSYGTEGRRGRPEEEVGPSDQVYEYIVFRGSDVKDLRIEEHPSIKENKPPAMPDDPAIVGVSSTTISISFKTPI
jgi:hypothetical protein